MISKLVEDGLHWASSQLGVHGQIGLAAILLVVAFEARHLAGPARSAGRAASTLWWFALLLGVGAFSGVVTVHVDVLVDGVTAAVPVVRDAVEGLIP